MKADAAVMFERMVQRVRKQVPTLRFEILEIGAVPLGKNCEPFHRFLDDFPGSRIHAFEIDPANCEALRRRARPGMEIHEVAISRHSERRTLHLTKAPVCTSLYRPNEPLNNRFHNLDVASLRDTAEIQTVSIDDFTAQAGIERIDFVKIDIQGAELDAFQGGTKSLTSSVAIVSEVEFIELYENQPLFADVDRELRGQGFMFHKFLSLEGRSLKPVVVNNNPDTATWHLWADAIYVRSMANWPQLDPESLIRLGLLAYVYGSPDVTYQCLSLCDRAIGSDLARSVAAS